MSRERVQKLLSQAGLGSRREAEEWVVAGRVTINGEIAELGSSADPELDIVKVDGERLRVRSPYRYFLLNKPKGCLTTHKDPIGRPTIFDLLPMRLRPGLKAVGRLDFQTEGLMLLTDDGDLAQKVAHPRYGSVKTYSVKVKGLPTREQLDRLRSGIPIDGRKTRPARIRRLTGVPGQRTTVANSWWTVEISEGRNRQIREMFHRVGHPVLKLRRIGIGGVSDPRLLSGHYRDLTPDEIDLLRTGEAPPEKTAPKDKKAAGWAVAKRRTRPPSAGRGRRGGNRKGKDR